MPRILVDPLNLNLVLVGIAALVSAAYFVRVPDKSASTWCMLWFLVAWAAFAMSIAFWSFTHGSITADATFYASALGAATMSVGALAGPLLAQAAYRFRGTPFPREALAVAVISVAPLVPLVWTVVNRDQTFAVATSRWIVAFWSLWGVVVLLRKRRLAGRTSQGRRDRTGMAAVAGFLLVVAVSETMSGFNGVDGSPLSSGFFIFGEILQYTVVLAFPVVYVQYAPEPTTFQVKLVGFVLLVVLAAFGVLNAHRSAMDAQRQTFDPAPPPHTVTFTPARSGFAVSRGDLAWENDIGSNLGLLDDSKVVVPLGFGFPFAGDTLFAVVATGNGSIEPTDTAYPFTSFTKELMTFRDRPLIAPWYTDLNPGAGGAVHADARADRLVVTWRDVPEWNFFDPHTLQAVLYSSGRIDFNYAELPFDTYVGASGVLVDPSQNADLPVSSAVNLDDIVGLGAIVNPIVTYDRRREFKAYLHAETMPFVRVVFGTLVFVLVIAPLFFRLSLTRPLQRLLQGMRRVNEGDLDAELPVGVKDEFGYASLHFNRMTQSLRAYSNEMESLVAERTRELNRSLESLKATQEQLVQQEKMASLGQLTAGIAHEIKNPLNFINNFAELNAELLGELLEASRNGEDVTQLIADLRQNAGLIAEHGKRADGIVRSMMEHARTGTAEKEEVDVNAFVEEYLSLAYHGKRASTADFNVTLERDYAGDAGTVRIVRQDMARVLINVIGNAFDALHAYCVKLKDERGAGSAAVSIDYAPTLRVSTRRERGPDDSAGRGSTRAGERVVIEVTDNGPGVAGDLKQRIFEPFFTTKPTGQGTGLGLSLSYDIVTKGHGGAMRLEDADGGGAKFVVVI